MVTLAADNAGQVQRKGYAQKRVCSSLAPKSLAALEHVGIDFTSIIVNRQHHEGQEVINHAQHDTDGVLMIFKDGRWKRRGWS